ncbi:MAG: hypothetical protein ACRDMX_15475 [Solirubrobacteraceae bacterium]
MSCRRGSIHALGALLAVTALAGCGLGSGPTGDSTGHAAKPQATVSVLAPMSGATVGVSQVVVTGTVEPAGAAVRVDGLPAKVRGTTFTRRLSLSRAAPTTTIPVTAGATGYADASLSVTVHYSRSLASAIAAARAATLQPAAATTELSPALPSPGTPKSGGFVPTLTLSAPPSNGGSSPAASSSPRGAPAHGPTSGGAPRQTEGGAPAPGPTSGAPAPTSGGTPAPAPTSGGAPAPAPTTEPPQPVALTPQQIQQLYMAGCQRASGGAKARVYCGCIYGHVRRVHALSSRARIAALARKIRHFQATGNLKDLPHWLLEAQISCASKLPPPALRLTSLPVLHHPAAPSR